MEVNYRMIAILEIIFAAEGQVTLQQAMEVAGTSRRSLLYNIEKTNGFLQENGFTPIEVCRGSLSWDIAQEQQVKQALSVSHTARYALSKSERKAITVIWTAVNREPVTLDLLSGLFDVSRNTVVSEVGELKNELAQIGLNLNSLGRQGYRLEGEETTARYYIMECIYSLPSGTVLQLAQEHIQEAAGELCGKQLLEEEYITLCDIVAESERQTSLRFNNNSIREAVLYLLLILVRANNGYATLLGKELQQRSEYSAAGMIISRMHAMGLLIPVQEQGYITTVLLASKVFDIHRQPGNSGIDLEAFAGDLVDTFSAKACVQFTDRNELVSRLLLHVRPMYYRLKYKIKVRNVLTEDIRCRYRDLFNLTDLAVKTVEGRYGLSIPDDEIAYLCVYIGGWMKHPLALDGAGTPKILVVCGAGIGTSLLLRDQLNSLLGQGYHYVTKDVRETDCTDTLEYQLIVTTVNLPYCADNIIQVNPILTQNQQNKLLAWSVQMGGSGELQKVEDLLEIVRKYTTIQDESLLTNRLLSYLSQGKTEVLQKPASIIDVLPPTHLRLIDTPMTAEEAIRSSCQILIDKGLVHSDYPQSILNIIDMLGLYAEIAEGILLAHGRPDEEVCGVGLTISLLRVPVVFPKWDKGIRVIFTLATPNNEAHLFILRDIMKLLKKDDVRKRLTDCSFDSVQEAYTYIVQELNK